MPHPWLFGTVLFGLAASLSWGTGDFSGGLASRRVHAFSVVLAVYVVGVILLPILALAWSEPLPSWSDTLWGAAAGLAGTVGLTAFYRSLAIGRMGINAPITSVLAAALPVIFSAFSEGLPRPLQMAGFALALLAVALVSRPQRASGRPEGLGLALLAGLGFGSFFILIGQVSAHAIFWPLTASRIASLLFMIVFMRIRGEKLLPKKSVLPLLLLAGTLDVSGNVFFVLATHSGRLDVASILSSLYSAVTILLAAIILRERVSRIQAIGIALALGAIVLISV
ncbi:MAG TPA: DMT family transporter [Ktedonobacteraceae bacterium]|nr:DMT family transporter [Ktedonobacteraceae bacterium]